MNKCLKYKRTTNTVYRQKIKIGDWGMKLSFDIEKLFINEAESYTA